MKKPNQLSIVVTGANGFVAKNLRNFCSKKHIKLIGIARRNFHKHKNERKIISPQLFSNEQNLRSLKCSALIHLIGSGKQTVNSNYESVNVGLTKQAISLCKKNKIKKIIYISGLGVSKETSFGYFISKYRAEQEIINSGLDYTIFRASYIIGKNDPLTKSFNKQIKNGSITIPGSGNYHLQPISVNDVASIIYDAITSKQFSNKILDLVGPEIINFTNYVKLFIGNRKIKIKKISLEKAYFDALRNANQTYGIDDLNILVGDFIGDHKKLQKISKLKFKIIRELLKTSSLS